MTANYLPRQSYTRKFISRLATVAAVATLAACASTQGLHTEVRPTDPATLHAERTFAHVKTSAAAWPKADWWTTLGDSQLDALIDEALRDNPDLASADARARAAQSQVDSANAKRLPTLGADASVTGVRLPTTAFPEPIGGHFQAFPAIYASFNWSLDLWGGKRAAWEAAVGQARAAEIDAHAAGAMGLVGEVVPHDELDARTDWILEQISSTGPLARATIKRDINSQLRSGDVSLFMVPGLSAEITEGMGAFVEKRAAVWPRP